jgi:hypothetical protein
MDDEVKYEGHASDRVPPDLRVMRSPQIPESRKQHCQSKYEEKAVRKSKPASRQQEVAKLQQTDGKLS